MEDNRAIIVAGFEHSDQCNALSGALADNAPLFGSVKLEKASSVHIFSSHLQKRMVAYEFHIVKLERTADDAALAMRYDTLTGHTVQCGIRRRARYLSAASGRVRSNGTFQIIFQAASFRL